MKIQLHIEENTPGNELAGEDADNWERVRREWFEITPLTGREYVQARQMQSDVSHRLRCVYFPGAHSLMRLTAGDDSSSPERTFHVESVVNVGEENRFLEWMCREAT